MDLQMRSAATARPNGGTHEQLVTFILEGIAVIKNHVMTEINRATAPLIARIARLESEQRASKPCKPVKLLARKPVKLIEPIKRIGPVKCF